MVRLLPIVTIAITSPSILYLLLRCSRIILRKWLTLRHHVARGGISPLAVHVIGGMALLGTTPYLAYLCLPPTNSNSTTTEDNDEVTTSRQSQSHSSVVQQHRHSLLSIAIVLFFINASVLFLLPHPLTRHEEYKTTPRIMVRSVGLMFVNAVEFASMSLGPIAFLSRHEMFAGMTLLLATTLYGLSIAISYAEIRNIPWEESAVARYAFKKIVGRGPPSRSALVSNAIGNPDGGGGLFKILFSIGIYAGVQSAMQCRRFLFVRADVEEGEDWLLHPDPGLEDFFVVCMIYSAVVMSASFFSFSQFDPTVTSKEAYLWDVLLGQMLPVFVTGLGPYWMMSTSDDNGRSDVGSSQVPFMWQWTFWTRSVPW